MTKESKNEGEGNRTAARRYNKATREFVDSGKVEISAKKARKDLESSEGERLMDAEEKGRTAARR